MPRQDECYLSLMSNHMCYGGDLFSHVSEGLYASTSELKYYFGLSLFTIVLEAHSEFGGELSPQTG